MFNFFIIHFGQSNLLIFKKP